jgi:hypothetical protein
LAKLKEKESYLDSDSDSEQDKEKQIIDVEPSATITTAKIQPDELAELEEGECLFHS